MTVSIQKVARFSILSASMLSLGLFGLACNSSTSSPKAASPQVQQQQGPAWELLYQVNAGTADKTTVIGAYGFTVTADANYIVGPGPNGQLLKGKLSDSEFSAIQSALQPVIDSNALTQSQTCGPSDVADYSDALTFIKGQQKTPFLSKATDGTVCANGYDVDDAEGLRSAVIAAATDHYDLPFPSACLEAANAVQVLYAGLTSCTQDSDCAYVASDYTAIPADQSQDVYEDNCSVIENLPVANASALAIKTAALQAALATAQATCGPDQILRSGCTTQTYFDSLAAAPVCEHQVCRISPNIQQ